MTRYVVLTSGVVEDDHDWAEVARVEAHSAAAAIRRYVTEKLKSSGVFVAVPERMFRPVTVKVETTQRVRLS